MLRYRVDVDPIPDPYWTEQERAAVVERDKTVVTKGADPAGYCNGGSGEGCVVKGFFNGGHVNVRSANYMAAKKSDPAERSAKMRLPFNSSLFHEVHLHISLTLGLHFAARGEMESGTCLHQIVRGLADVHMPNFSR